MFQNFARSICVAAVLAAGAVGMTSAPAAAGDFSFGITIGTPGYHHGRHYRPVSACAPARALRKARHLGVHRARLFRANRRTVVVAGRSRGDRATVRFAQRRDCPVISFRRR